MVHFLLYCFHLSGEITICMNSSLNAVLRRRGAHFTVFSSIIRKFVWKSMYRQNRQRSMQLVRINYTFALTRPIRPTMKERMMEWLHDACHLLALICLPRPIKPTMRSHVWWNDTWYAVLWGLSWCGSNIPGLRRRGATWGPWVKTNGQGPVTVGDTHAQTLGLVILIGTFITSPGNLLPK